MHNIDFYWTFILTFFLNCISCHVCYKLMLLFNLYFLLLLKATVGTTLCKDIPSHELLKNHHEMLVHVQVIAEE